MVMNECCWEVLEDEYCQIFKNKLLARVTIIIVIDDNGDIYSQKI